ncbi:uncharacterized protein LOC126576547 [Anopheles aquasalis]|uniref:uncharacterized protein LOC126576546 n=1 Tax=Anopheles aquasalis TaxID=42839 RepID=UPI00215A673B|nr:uncharacterized protein LOC126576546 [Anopheles aquasalis]XP_050093816.1 uncharacterized protein LOC126576547 [Anopheles aquasalis]
MAGNSAFDKLAGVQSASQLERIIEDDETLVTFLMEAGILPASRNCPTPDCGRPMTLNRAVRRSDKYRWVCRGGACAGREVSVRDKTIFSDSKMPMRQIIHLIFEWSRDGDRDTVAADVGCHLNTVYSWFKILREAAALHVRNSHQILGGTGETIEVDESVLVKRKANRGRMPANAQKWVVGGICRRTRRCFFELVEDRSMGTIESVIGRHVASGTTIMTDGWRSYNNLDERGFGHMVVNHSLYFVCPLDRNVHTQNIENRWRWLKRFLSDKGSHKGNIETYMEEYLFRNRCACANVSVFAAILQIVVNMNRDGLG